MRSKPKQSAALAPGLYLVATPIGNLADISLRALDVLAKADLVACEDTRTTRKLLSAHGIGAALTSYHEHNATRVRPRLVERLISGQALALVSDAGTPLADLPMSKASVRGCGGAVRGRGDAEPPPRYPVCTSPDGWMSY